MRTSPETSFIGVWRKQTIILGVALISVADPVHFFRIRICGSGFNNSDPDPCDSKSLSLVIAFSNQI